MSKSTLKNRFFSKRLAMKQNMRKLKRNSICTLISGWGELFSKGSTVPKLTVSLKRKTTLQRAIARPLTMFLAKQYHVQNLDEQH